MYTEFTTLVVVVAILVAVATDAPHGLKDRLTPMVDPTAVLVICGIVPGGSSLKCFPCGCHYILRELTVLRLRLSKVSRINVDDFSDLSSNCSFFKV